MTIGINGINGTSASAQTSGATSSAVSAATGGQTLGQDAFLKLLLAQMKNQDPLQPMDNTAFVSQLAQFSALEQQVTTNQLLKDAAAQQGTMQQAQDVALVGKTVTVSGATVNVTTPGLAVPFGFALAGQANTVDVSISDASGNVVRTMHLGPARPGGVSAAWDGNNDGGTPQPAGNYNVSVTAKDANGTPVDVSQQSTGVVQSLSFGQGGASLVLSNGVTAPTSNLISVGQ